MLFLTYPCAYVNYHLAETSLKINHSEVKISIFTCANQHEDKCSPLMSLLDEFSGTSFSQTNSRYLQTHTL